MDGNVMNRTILFSILLGSLCGIILGAPSNNHQSAPRSPSSPTIGSDFTLPRSSKSRQTIPVSSSPTTRRDRHRAPNSGTITNRNSVKNSLLLGGKVSTPSQIPPRSARRIHAVIPQPTESLTYNYHNKNNNNNGFSSPNPQQQQQEAQSQLEHRQLESTEELSSGSQRIYQDQSQSQQVSSVEDNMNGNNNNNDGNLDDTAQNMNENTPYRNLDEQPINLDNIEFRSPPVSQYPGDQQQLQQQLNQPGAIMSFQNYPMSQQQQHHGNDLGYGVLPTINFVDQGQHHHPHASLPPFPQQQLVNVPQTGIFSIPLSPSPNTLTTIYKPSMPTSQNNNKMSSKINKNNNNNNNYNGVNPVLPQISVTSHDPNLDNNNNNIYNGTTTSSTGNSTNGSPQRRIHIDIVF